MDDDTREQVTRRPLSHTTPNVLNKSVFSREADPTNTSYQYFTYVHIPFYRLKAPWPEWIGPTSGPLHSSHGPRDCVAVTSLAGPLPRRVRSNKGNDFRNDQGSRQVECEQPNIFLYLESTIRRYGKFHNRCSGKTISWNDETYSPLIIDKTKKWSRPGRFFFAKLTCLAWR